MRRRCAHGLAVVLGLLTGMSGCKTYDRGVIIGCDEGSYCEFPQPDICQLYVECVDATSPEHRTLVSQHYGHDGSCWCSDQATAEWCEQTCIEQLELAHAQHPDEPVCDPTDLGMPQSTLEGPLGPDGS